MTAFIALVAHELKLFMRAPADALASLAFFTISVSLFAIALGPDKIDLQNAAAGVVWVVALLAILLALPHMFAEDYADGALEVLASSGNSLVVVTLAKMLVTWLVTALPLIAITPIIAILFAMDDSATYRLLIGLLLGTPAMTALGAIGAALTLGLKTSSVLLTLIILPLYIPPMIFAVLAVQAWSEALLIAHWSLLAAFSLCAVFFAPFATALALKIALE